MIRESSQLWQVTRTLPSPMASKTRVVRSDFNSGSIYALLLEAQSFKCPCQCSQHAAWAKSFRIALRPEPIYAARPVKPFIESPRTSRSMRLIAETWCALHVLGPRGPPAKTTKCEIWPGPSPSNAGGVFEVRPSDREGPGRNIVPPRIPPRILWAERPLHD